MTFNAEMLRNNEFIPPPKVMMTAARPKNGNRTSELQYDPDDASKQFHPYLHFAEVEPHEETQRNFTIFLNGNLFFGPSHLLINPYPLTVTSKYPVGGTSIHFLIVQANDSELPPILNAFEFYSVKQFLQSPTRKSDSEFTLHTYLNPKIPKILLNNHMSSMHF